jgi:TonB family protein
MSGIRELIGVALLAALPAAPPPPSAPDPGAVVLLASRDGHTVDAELRRALQDADPRTRLVAARVIGVAQHTELFADIADALARENDPAAGGELVRAALYLKGAAAFDVVDPQARRLGLPAVVTRAEWLARTQPREFAAALPDLVTALGSRAWRLTPLIAMAAAQHPATRASIFAVWMENAPARAWGDLLEIAYAAPARLESAQDLLAAGLASARSSTREETIWFLVKAGIAKRDVPAALLDAALPVEQGSGSEWEQFGRELIARRRQNIQTPDRSDLLLREGAAHAARRLLADSRDLTKRERAALVDAPQARTPTTMGWQESAAPLRTVSLPAGVVAATVAAAGCKPAGTDIVAAEISYWPDGRPHRIGLGASRLPPACVDALGALARVTIAETGEPVGEAAQLVVLPFHKAFLGCGGRTESLAASDSRGRTAAVETPHKVVDVKPFYPEDAQRARIQGIVVIDASVTDEGCVASARVLHSVPSLDVPALWAVTQWRFDPPRVDGAVSAMQMTVTVSFRLR